MLINGIKDLLDIFIITYNRDAKLDKTLEQILSDNSPIKNFCIKIIDNNSSDNTRAVVEKYQKNFPNIEYLKNKYNIGGNANIMKAFYQVEKDYCWILADNDYYCWDSWEEVINSINSKKDAIMVSTYEYPETDIAQFFIQTTFLPGMIFKKDLLDDVVMGNMAFNLPNLFPHLAVSSRLINEHKDVHIVKNAIVNIGDNTDEKTGKYTYTRGYPDSRMNPLMRDMNWLTGYANSLHMIKDKKIRNYIATHNKFYLSELNSAKLFDYNAKVSNASLYNLLSIFCVLDIPNKLRFLFNWLGYYTFYRILYVYSINRRANDINSDYYFKEYRIRLFYFIKTRLFKFKIRRQK